MIAKNSILFLLIGASLLGFGYGVGYLIDGSLGGVIGVVLTFVIVFITTLGFYFKRG